ncbi:MAG: DEAD/DEAH box helicase [Ardenticatenales bacterium]
MHEPLPSDPAPDAAADAAAERPRGITIDDLSPRLRAATVRTGWPALTPVQSEAIPLLLEGRNAMVQARTGSGKTGAFLLPMLERLDPSEDGCQALILVPTRELARQVWQQAEVIFADTPLRTVAVYGGVGYGPQTDALRGGAHIVVGTPGRVLDHLLKRNFSLDDLRMLIFDEADRMLSMGFYPDMRQVQRYLPKRPVHGCMFSATFPAAVLRTAEQFIKDPEFLSLSQDHVHVTDIEHVYYNIPGTDKDRSLVRIIEIENPASALIFCNTKSKVHYVSVVLRRFGYDADELSADLSQADRERVLERVTAGKLRFLVATDVAGRGIDIPDLSHVIQYEPPEDPESYVHRAGRTGRAGAGGVAINLVYAMESLALARIAARWEIDMEERPLPSDADVEAVVTERLTALLEARLRERDKLQTERSRRFIALGRSLAESEDELPIIAMLLDDMYQQLMHAPADGPVGPKNSSGAERRSPPSREPRESRDDRGGREPRPPHGRSGRADRPEREGDRPDPRGLGGDRDPRGHDSGPPSNDVVPPAPTEEAPRRPASSYYRTAPGGPVGGWQADRNGSDGPTSPRAEPEEATPDREGQGGEAQGREVRGPEPRRRRRRGGGRGEGGGVGGGIIGAGGGGAS